MTRTADRLKDQQLIGILRQNARIPISDIAKKLNVSRTTAQSRLSRLERDGIVAGYTVVMGAGTAAPELLHILVLVEIEIRAQAKIVSELKKIAEVVACHTISGQYDIIVRVECRRSAELDELIDRISHIEGVKRTISSVILARKFER